MTSYVPEYERCPPAETFHCPIEEVNPNGRKRRVEAIRRLKLPRYELFEYSRDLYTLLSALDSAGCDLERFRSALEWDRLRPGEGPPSRELVIECASYFKLNVTGIRRVGDIVMLIMNELSVRMN